jgi:hypothetical protein
LARAIAMPVKQHDVDRHAERRRYCIAPAESLPETGLFLVLEPSPPDSALDWEFPPGSVVRCESIIVGRMPCWVAGGDRNGPRPHALGRSLGHDLLRALRSS